MKSLYFLVALLLVGCGESTTTASSAPIQQEPTRGAYSITEITTSPVYRPADASGVIPPPTWFVAVRAECAGCDMNQAFGVPLVVQVDGVPKNNSDGFQVSFSGTSPSNFVGVGWANVGEIPDGAHTLTAMVVPSSSFIGNNADKTIAISVP